MLRAIRGLFDHARYHHKTRRMPAFVRRRIYRHLIDVTREEHRAAEMLALDVRPRLCIVDEGRVAMLRPTDREQMQLDAQMHRAREEEARTRESN